MHGHIEKRPNRGGGYTYRVTFVVGRRPDGTPDRRRESFDTERQAEEALARWAVAKADGTIVATDGQTFEAFLTHWLNVSKRNRVEDTTLSSYQDMIRTHIIPGLGSIPLQKLRAQQIEQFLAEKAVGGRLDGKPRGLSDRMITYLFTLIKASLNHAVRLRLVAMNEAVLVDPPRKRDAKREMIVWSDEELARFLVTAGEDRWHPLWHIALLVGMRREELLGLRWRDMDLDKGWLKVEQCVAARHGKISVKQTKNNASWRTIHLDPAAVDLLKEHRLRQKEHRMRTLRTWEAHDLVFPSLRGTPLDPDNATKYFNRVVEVSGVRRITLHGLRHLCASYGLVAGVDQLTLSRRLGHSRPSTTTDLYGRLVPGADERAAGTIATRILGRKERPA